MTAAVRSAVVLMTGLGGVLGGAAGTADWPVVGTFFGAAWGAVLGVVVGLVLGSVMGALSGVTRSRWAARSASGLVAGVLGMVAVGLGSGGYAVPSAGAIVLVAVGTLIAAALGPVIAFGVAPRPDGRPGLAWAVDAGTTFVAWGCGLGVSAGAVTGLVIGLGHPPTALFAAAEGGILGGVSGLVLAVAAAGVAVLPRLHPLP